ncbi:MAG: amidohydrolase [Acidimicrobiia bacterium]
MTEDPTGRTPVTTDDPTGRPSDEDLGPVISADDHMDLHVMPPTLFVDRVPRALQDRVPQVVDTADGPVWTVEGRNVGPSGRKGSGFIAADDHGLRPGVAEQRLEDLDRDGIAATVVYGPPFGLTFVEDREVRAACARAFNDWADEFNAVDRARLAVLAILPVHSPEAAAEELRRVAATGQRGAQLGFFEADEPPFTDAWDPFWAEVDEIGLPIHFHLSGGMHSLAFVDWQRPAAVTVSPMQLDEALVGMCFSGVFARHPNVRVVLGESGLGWLPYVLDRMDHEFHKYRDATVGRLDAPPSEYFRRHVFITYEEDPIGLAFLDRIGTDNVMWASDYPHGDSTWPNSRAAISSSALGALDPPTRRKIVHDNAARLYMFGR